MLATLDRPIVTDFHPIRHQPALLLIVLVLVAAAVVARDVVSAPVVLAVVGCGGLILWLASRNRRGRDGDDCPPFPA